MIDTDKYEGHDLSKEGWTGSDYIYNKKGDIIFDIDDLGGNEATLILLNDAPLLLEEVKRLREWKAEVERICRTMNAPNRDTALFIMTNEVEEE